MLEREYLQFVPIGTRIRVLSKGEGLFGGYIWLKDPQSRAVWVFAMRNYHVIRGDNPKWPAGKSKKVFVAYTIMTYTMPGFDYLDNKWPKGFGVVQSPSEADNKEEITKLEKYIAILEHKLETNPVTNKVRFGIANERQQATFWWASLSKTSSGLELDWILVKISIAMVFITIMSLFLSGFRSNKGHLCSWLGPHHYQRHWAVQSSIKSQPKH